MKQVLAGGFLSLVGSIWALAVVFIAGNGLVSGWSTPPGRFLTTVSEMGLTALFAAAVTLVGRSVGAGETRLARQQGNICTAMGALFMGVTAGIMALICPWVFRLLTPDESVRALATQVLRIALLAEPLYGVSIVAAGALRGTGDTFVPSIMNLCSIWLVRLGLALVLVPRLGLRGMWIAMAIELCVRGLLMLFRQLTTKYYEKYKKELV